jgi:ABC-type multidrug transport system fused ATPase/permease subunit
MRASWTSYKRYFFARRINYVLLPLIVILFIFTELIIFAYLRILADYDNVEVGESFYFSDSYALYWGVLILMVEAYFIFHFLKYLLLNVSVLMNNTEIHQNMIHALLRSPLSFFCRTPSGILTNKFTTDVSLLDNSLVVAIIDALEGVVLVGVAIFNMVRVDAYFAILAAVLLLFGLLFFLFSQAPIMACKQLDLQEKGPIFHAYSETVNNLIQIRLCNLRETRIRQFSEMINQAVKASISYEMVERAFDFCENQFSLLLLALGMALGIRVISPNDPGNFDTTVLYFITIC